jgi:HPr kinase/phosphorylase
VKSVSIRNLLNDQNKKLKLSCVAGTKGLRRSIRSAAIKNPGLALTGHSRALSSQHVHVFDKVELKYLQQLSTAQLRHSLKSLLSKRLPCIIIADNQTVHPQLLNAANKNSIPLLVSKLSYKQLVDRLASYLEAMLAETTTRHGVLVDVGGIGILLLGKSGIGKSECALELVMRGCRLVADDVVHIKRQSQVALLGWGSELIKYHMEIRGVGIINIKDLFGVASVRDKKLIEMIIEIVAWDESRDYERLGLDDATHRILDVAIPYLEIPARPGRSLSTIIEVAARNELLKSKGYHAPRALQEQLTHELLTGTLDKG